MTTIHRSALVEYSAERMFDLVNDIEQYPKFMQGCVSAKVRNQSENELIGELCLSKAGVTQCFTTSNALNKPNSIRMNLLEGNFASFNAEWKFKELRKDACKVSFHLEFEFKSGIMGFAVEKLFSSSANNLVDALVGRAKQVYS